MTLSILTNFAVLCAMTAATAVTAVAGPPPFKPIDLGYATHIPSYINQTASNITYATYANIRFAQPPTGSLRFRRPQTPPPTQTGIQDGHAGFGERDCLIAAPTTVPYPEIAGKSWGTEDCLFLNVVLPQGVEPGDKVPVLHWLYGSAFAFGSKDWSADPMGLMDRLAHEAGVEKFIWVASNYRLGATGWIASPSEPSMDANVGIYDGLAALEWTRTYISKFGGDPDRVTAMGQSAGASLIEHMIVSHGDSGSPLPFKQAIVASPAILPRRGVSGGMQELYEILLNVTNCTSLQCLREIPEAEMRAANARMLIDIPQGDYGALGPGIGFMPIVDGEYIPDLPGTLLKEGRFHKDVEAIWASNMATEAALFRPPEDSDYSTFPGLVQAFVPNATNETEAAVQQRYPPNTVTPIKPFWDFQTDINFACNAWELADAFRNKRTYREVMSIPPAWHGLDANYFFYVSNATTPVDSIPLALRVQDSILNFVRSGNPNPPHPLRYGRRDAGGYTRGLWPTYGKESLSLNISLVGDGWGIEQDRWDARQGGRCEFLRDLTERTVGRQKRASTDSG